MNHTVCVVIPNYNGKQIIHECLLSLGTQTHKPVKTIIVDDASTDGSLDFIRTNFPEVETIRLKKNKGFARTVNAGIRHALRTYAPEFVAILNNDTKVEPGWIAALVSRAETGQDIAAVTSNMLFYDHPEIINSQGGTIDWNGDGYDINFGTLRKHGNKKSSEVIGACFGAALIRSEALRNIGLLDEAFGAYFEDLDWSWRAHLYGYRVLFEPKAVVYHKHSASYNKMPYKKLYYCKRNALRTALKNYERRHLPRFIAYILIGYWFAIVGYFQTSKHRLPFLKKVGFVSIPLLALLWNMTHLADTLRNRKKIQRERIVHDEKIMFLAEQDFTPVREWLKHLKEKFPISKKATQRNMARAAAPFRTIGQHATHKVLLPIAEKTKHKVILPLVNRLHRESLASIPRELEALNRRLMRLMRLMRRILPGDAHAENVPPFIDDEIMAAHFETVFANLPFRLFWMRKEDFFKNESALVIDACVFFSQLPLYRDEKSFTEVLKKIHSSARHLKRARIDWKRAIACAEEINASSQLYGYLRLIAASENALAIPREVIKALRQHGSRVQNALIDRFRYEALKKGVIPFSLKLYSRMYVEHGLLKYLTTRAHSLYNGKDHREDTTYRGPASIELSTEPIEARPRYIGAIQEEARPPMEAEPPYIPAFQKFGVNIFGFLDSESGVGEAARTIARAVMQNGISCALLNSPRCPHRRKENEFLKKFSTENPYAVNIIAFYGDVFENELRAFGEQKFKNKYNIAYWAWELSSLPASWTALLGNVDEVWTPSSFSAEAIKKAKKDIPVTVIPHAITMRKCPYPRKRFGLPDDMFLFLFTFDFYSIFERKNPLAVVRAFRSAFRPDERAGLVIKSSNHNIDPENFAALQKESKAHNIFLLNDYLAREEISSLMNVCDSYVSLHRSEGFGLSLAESMILGKPVIATDYSGNVDFLNEGNGFPVPFTLIPLEKDYGPYKRGNVWADPDMKKAAEAMRIIYDYPEIAGRKGGRARNDAVAKLSPAAVAKLIEKRLLDIKRKRFFGPARI